MTRALISRCGAEFRTRLIEGGAERLLLERLLEVSRERGWLKRGGKQRTDSTHVLASVRALSHLETVGETLRAVLEEVAEVAPEWLVQQIDADWLLRYGQRVEQYRLPKAESKRQALAEQIGADGRQLLSALQQAEAPAELGELESVRVLAQVWEHYYEQTESGAWKWLTSPKVAEAQRISSPYDPQARSGHKRDVVWLGYKSHLTETCEPERPRLIVEVETTLATTTDVETTAPIQQALAQQDLLPDEQLVDTGYVDGPLLWQSQRQYGVRLLGPALPDSSWQARAGRGFDQAQFQVDWQQQQVTCPQGQRSVKGVQWQEAKRGEYIHVEFAAALCQTCPSRVDCTRSPTSGRELRLPPQPIYEAVQARRQEQTTPAFQRAYALRAGVEATISQGVRRMGLRRSRYVGLRKTHLQHLLTAVAINLVRIEAWLTGPPARKRRTHLTRLASHPDLRQGQLKKVS
jgi:transposase